MWLWWRNSTVKICISLHFSSTFMAEFLGKEKPKYKQNIFLINDNPTTNFSSRTYTIFCFFPFFSLYSSHFFFLILLLKTKQNIPPSSSIFFTSKKKKIFLVHKNSSWKKTKLTFPFFPLFFSSVYEHTNSFFLPGLRIIGKKTQTKNQ